MGGEGLMSRYLLITKKLQVIFFQNIFLFIQRDFMYGYVCFFCALFVNMIDIYILNVYIYITRHATPLRGFGFPTKKKLHNAIHNYRLAVAKKVFFFTLGHDRPFPECWWMTSKIELLLQFLHLFAAFKNFNINSF